MPVTSTAQGVSSFSVYSTNIQPRPLSRSKTRASSSPSSPRQSTRQWQTAMEALLLAVRGGPTKLARIGVMKALNRHVVREFKT